MSAMRMKLSWKVQILNILCERFNRLHPFADEDHSSLDDVSHSKAFLYQESLPSKC